MKNNIQENENTHIPGKYKDCIYGFFNYECNNYKNNKILSLLLFYGVYFHTVSHIHRRVFIIHICKENGGDINIIITVFMWEDILKWTSYGRI